MARDPLKKNLTVFLVDETPKISVNGTKGYYGLTNNVGHVVENKWDILLGTKCMVTWK